MCFVKVALINTFISTVDQISILNVRGVAHSDKPTEKTHLTLQSASFF